MQPAILLDPVQLRDSTGVAVSPATEDTLAEVQTAINDAVNYLAGIASSRGIASDIRVTLLSGTVTTVTTVTTVAGITNIGGIAAYPVQSAQMNNLAVLSNINNLVA